MAICEICNKNIDDNDEFWGSICFECFENVLNEEEEDIQVYNKQEGNCFLCSRDLYGWVAKEINGAIRVVCWPDCKSFPNEKPLIITLK